ncbi:TPP-requiring enzyme co-localized with fatty acid metabolic genes [Rhodococcus wratislaviensis]|uniref:acetolactate synthase n=1 Tax=Rhodococcus wratislaviensis TaxID=44752 RepID=A0A402CL37_RHOWR|nr:thiamine pyrophosphate-binding protein [Rhodococcus wratislaviensis]GCE44293.1 TPP-requiring enzyme co-localized with fatty acid metabolic genes [Rhodococcus wratislaviensis]
MKTYEVAAAALSKQGARTIFGLMGDANLAYVGAYVENEGGEFVAAVAEGSAVSMADGFHRMTGEVGVASVTHGPAVTNCLTALTEAVRARSEVLLITGGTPDVRHHFQALDLEGFARGAGAQYLRVRRPDDAPGDIAQAFVQVRAAGRPLVLDIPYDLLERPAEHTSVPHADGGRTKTAPDRDALDDALGILLSTRRPLILAGRGAVRAGARDDILRLARLLDAPVMTTLLAKDLFHGEPENLGIHGNLSSGVAAEEIARADCVLAFGASLNTFTTDGNALLRGKSVIQCDDRVDAVGRFGLVSLALIADAGLAARAMCARLAEAGHTSPGIRRVTALQGKLTTAGQRSYRSITGGGTVDMRDAMKWLGEVLPSGTQVVTDVGRFSFAAWKHLDVTPGRFTVPGTFGSIGLGIGTAVGAAAARRDVPTVCVAGDGGGMMGILELSTAVRYELPLVVVILNDNCYGAEYRKLADLGLNTRHSEVAWPEFGEVGRSLGAQAVTVREEKDLAVAAEAIANGTFPLLIEIKADPARRRPGKSI